MDESRIRRKRKPQPFHPLAKVVRIGNVAVEQPVRNRVMLARGIARVLRLALALSVASNVEEDLVVHNVSSEAQGPHDDTEPESGTCECGGLRHVGRGEERAQKRTVAKVECDCDEWLGGA